MGGVSCGSPALLSSGRQDSDVAFPAPIHPTVPELKRAAHHQRRCLHRIHLSEVTRSVQRPAVVPLVECGIVVWSRRGDSQSVSHATSMGGLHHPHRRCAHCPAAPHTERESLSYLVPCCSSGSPPGRISCLQAQESTSGTVPAVRSRRGNCSLHHLGEPRPSPKKPSKAQTDGQKRHPRPILMALCEQLRLPGKPQLKNKGEDKHQVPQVPTRQRDDGRHRC